MNLTREQFIEKQKQQRRFVVTEVLEGDTQTPVALFQKIVGEEKGFLLESKEEGKGRYSIIGKAPIREIKGSSLEEVRSILEAYQTAAEGSIPFVGGAVGYMAYDIAKQFENIPTVNEDVLQMPNLHFMIVDMVVLYDHFMEKIILVKNAGMEDTYEEILEKFEQLKECIEANLAVRRRNYSVPKQVPYRSNTTKEKFMENVIKAKEYISNGDIFQVVLSQRIQTEVKKHPFEIYRVLRGVNPSPYLFYINFGDYQLAGSSPEMMVEVRDQKVSTCPIAGTYPRGKDPEEDEMLAQKLLKDEKEVAEHVMLIDLARNDVGKISQFGKVEVPKLMEVEKYSHVMHLVSKVRGTLKPEYNMIDALISTVPAGTLSGAPKIRAMEIIEELETEKRSVYGGAIGYLGFDGNMDTCIAIRTIVFKDQKAYVQAGAGIVLDSVPEKEYEESFHKARALLRAIEIAEGEDV